MTKSRLVQGIFPAMVFSPLAFFAASASAAADDSSSGNIDYKLTASYYNTDSDKAGDINLRAHTGAHTAWLGHYQDDTGFRQARAGYEYAEDEGVLRVTWSAQAATRGFVGGSATAEIGGDTFAIAGIGRTNLHDYYNLNFDPNDAWTAGIGSRAIDNTELSLFRVQDDRTNSRQRVTHAVVRYKFAGEQRLTLDASYKNGFGSDGIYYNGYGISAAYDYQRWFVRLAEDQHANFSHDNMLRLSTGVRF